MAAIATRKTWAWLYLIVGIALIAYAIYAHDVIAGITMLLLILLGAIVAVLGVRQF